MAIVGNKDRPAGRSLLKDFHRLLKNITGMSGGQARLASWDESDLKKGITVSVIPDSGLYKDGEFFFSIACNSKYPNRAPDVCCKTFIYHPNIDPIDSNGDICLNLLDDGYWTSTMTLEDIVQGILFLMHNPNLDDPLCVLFSPGMDEEEFADNVRASLEGGLVEGYHFERNRVTRGDADRDMQKEVVCQSDEHQSMKATGKKEDVRSQTDSAADKNKNLEERRNRDVVGAGVG